MKNYFRYSIVRFRPYAEIGEFANIGIVVLDTFDQIIDFKLAPKRFSRLRHFFDESGYRSYFGAIDLLRVELARISGYLPDLERWDGESAFQDITRNRESSIVFSEPRVTSSELPLKVLVDKLYSRFVKREFSAEDPEIELTRDIRRTLHRNGVHNFKTIKVDDDLVPVTFPLAYQARSLFAIKPLAFDQKSPLSIVDYGAHWNKRLRYLLDRHKIGPHNVLLAITRPSNTTERAVRDAFNLATEELEQLPLHMVDGEVSGVVNPAIVEFARNVTAQPPWFQ